MAARNRPGREAAGRTAVKTPARTVRAKTGPGREAAGVTTTKGTAVNGRSAVMQKMAMMDVVDSWMKTQSEFADNWAKAQREGVERWAEAAMKMQESLQGFGGPQEGPAKEMRSFFASWSAAVVNSVKAFADDSAKIQNVVKAGVERQVSFTREMAQRFAEMFPAPAQVK